MVFFMLQSQNKDWVIRDKWIPREWKGNNCVYSDFIVKMKQS